MLIGHTMPAILSIAISSTKTGAAFVGTTSDGLIDGIPARVARLQWMTASGQTTADYVRLSLPFNGAAQIHRIACVLGLTLPIGTQVRAELYDATSGGTLVAGTTTRAVRVADGSIGAWFVWPVGTAASRRLEVLIYNDVNGSASIAAGTLFEIGEIAVMQGVVIGHASEWSDDLVDPSETTLTRDAQPATVSRTPYRRFEGELSADGWAAVRGGGLEGGMDWGLLRRAIAADARAIAVPRWANDAQAIDLDRVAQTALYGLARMGPLAHVGGDIYTATLTLTEAPAR